MGALKPLAIAVLAVLLSGCSWMAPRIVYVPPCTGWKEIYPATADLVPTKEGDLPISDSLASQVLAHNKYGQAICNCQPPNKPTGSPATTPETK